MEKVLDRKVERNEFKDMVFVQRIVDAFLNILYNEENKEFEERVRRVSKSEYGLMVETTALIQELYEMFRKQELKEDE